MDSPLLKYLERHQNKMRLILLIYVGVMLIDKIIFGPIVVEAFIRTGHLYSAIVVLLSLLTLICGLFGFIKLNRFSCIYFLIFYSFENFSRVVHDLEMMHQNYRLFSPIALKKYFVDVYSALIVSILILIIGTLLLYFDFLKKRKYEKVDSV